MKPEEFIQKMKNELNYYPSDEPMTWGNFYRFLVNLEEQLKTK